MNAPLVLNANGDRLDASDTRRTIAVKAGEINAEFISGASFAIGLSPEANAPLESSQDFGGVVSGEDGNVERFAVGDGVGGSCAPRSVAEIAVHSALTSPLNGPVDEVALKRIIQTAEDRVRKSLDVEALIGDVRAVCADLPGLMKGTIQMANLKRIRDGRAGETTLITGVKQDDDLHIAQLGDGGWAVLDANRVIDHGG